MSAILLRLAFLIGAAVPQSQAPPHDVAASAEYVQYDFVRYRDRVETEGGLTRELEVRVLLRTATAVAEFGQLEWPYVGGYGDVRFENVLIDRPDGTTVEVKNGLIEDLNPYGVTATSLSSDVRLKKLTIPGLEPGDWLSYRIVLHQEPLDPGRVFGEMKLAALVGDPVQTYELDLPQDLGIHVRLRDGLGAAWERVPAASDRLVKRLSLKVPRPPADQRTPTKAMIQAGAEPDVIFTSFPSWAEVGRWWWALSRDRLHADAAVKAEATRLLASKATSNERIAALHAFVASRVRYLNVSFGIGRMQPRPAADVLTNRYGDCKDKHALLAALASAVGIDVRPVLIDSVRTDLRDDVPSPQQFDHMISVARLGSEPAEWVWLDATNPFGPPGYLGPHIRDKRALLIEASGEGRIVRTPAALPFVPRAEAELKGTLEPDGAVRGRVVCRFRSDEEVALRSIFAVMPLDQRAEAVRASLGGDWKDGKITNVVISDPADTAEPFRIEFDAERPAEFKGMKSLRIPLPGFLRLPPANASVELVQREVAVRAEIEIPEGLTARAPRSVSLDRPFGKFESTYSVEGRWLKLAKTLKLARQSLSDDELISYGALRTTIDADRGTEFSLLKLSSASDPWSPATSPRRTETRSVLLPKAAVGKSVKQSFEVDEGVIDAELTDIPEGVPLCMCIGTPKGCRPFCGGGITLSGSIDVLRSDESFKPGGYEVSIYHYPWDAPRSRDVNAMLTVTYAPSATPRTAPSSESATIPSAEAAQAVRNALAPLKGSNSYSSQDPGVQSVIAMGRVAVAELLVMLREMNYQDRRLHHLYSLGVVEALARLSTDEDLPALAALLAEGRVEVARCLERLSGTAVRDALLVPLRKGFSGPQLTLALARYGKDPEVQVALVAYLEKFGPAADFLAGDVAELAGRAEVRAAVPVLTRLVATTPASSEARRMFSSALTSLHEPAGVRALLAIFSTTTGDVDEWERHEAGEELNRIVGERFYIGSYDGRRRIHGNFEEAAERFRVWWRDAEATIQWDGQAGKWVW